MNMLVIRPLGQLAIIILAFLLGMLINTKCTPEKRGVTTTKVVTTIKTDTIFIPKLVEKVVYVDKPTVRTVFKDRLIPNFQLDGTPTLQSRMYSDTLNIEPNLRIHYRANTSGTLDSIQLGIKDTRPERVITTTITNDITHFKSSTGLYVGLSGQLDGSQFGPSLNIVFPRFIVGTSYNLVRNNFTLNPSKITLSAGYKILGK